LPTIDYCLKVGISSREGLWADFTGDNEQLVKLQELSSIYRFDTWNQALNKINIRNEKLARSLGEEFKRIRGAKHILFPETTGTLDKLKGRYKLGLITNGAPDLQWKKINGGNLQHYFDYIAVSGEHGFAKPDGRLFDIAIKGLKSTATGSIMVGDSLDTDIKGGLVYGLKTIWINRNGEGIDMVKPDYEVTNLSGILKIIPGL